MSTTQSGTAIGSDLERELRRVVEGEVRFDDYSRLLYSTDASMYQVEPIGVVLPRSKDDVRAVLGRLEPLDKKEAAELRTAIDKAKK